jgi:hypothetical protein
MRGKEEAAAGKKRAQAATDELLTPCSKKSSLKVSQKTGSKELDAKTASCFYENGIA